MMQAMDEYEADTSQAIVVYQSGNNAVDGNYFIPGMSNTIVDQVMGFATGTDYSGQESAASQHEQMLILRGRALNVKQQRERYSPSAVEARLKRSRRKEKLNQMRVNRLLYKAALEAEADGFQPDEECRFEYLRDPSDEAELNHADIVSGVMDFSVRGQGAITTDSGKIQRVDPEPETPGQYDGHPMDEDQTVEVEVDPETPARPRTDASIFDVPNNPNYWGPFGGRRHPGM
jgi:hypothetical protein